MADIERAFLMISVEERDRDVLRFLWVDNIDEDEIKIRPLRFTRVVFGICLSPFLRKFRTNSQSLQLRINTLKTSLRIHRVDTTPALRRYSLKPLLENHTALNLL